MNKEFCTYEQSLALKELGFDEPCLVVWPGIEGQKLGYDGRYFSLVKGYKNSKLSKEVKKYAPGIIDVAAPLYQQAFRWFREKYGLEHKILRDSYGCRYQITKVTPTNLEDIDCKGQYSNISYEGAESACLDKLIAFVRDKQ